MRRGEARFPCSAGIVASLGLLAFSLSTTPPIIGLSYTAFFSFFVFFSLGIGPVTWLIPAEIFPVRLRARCSPYAQLPPTRQAGGPFVGNGTILNLNPG